VLPSLLVPAIRQAVARAACPRVLVANLAPEPGPVGHLPLKELVRWMDRVMGKRMVDAVLWPHGRLMGPDLDLPVQVSDVAGEDGRHDRSRLAAGLNELLEKLRHPAL